MVVVEDFSGLLSTAMRYVDFYYYDKACLEEFREDESIQHFWLSHSRAFLHKWRKLFCRQHLPRRHYLHRLRGSYVHLARVHPT